MIRYEVTINNPLSSFIHIKTQVPVAGTDSLYLQLPAWRPGRYELQHFAQRVQSFQVLNEQLEPVSFKKITKDKWQVDTLGCAELSIGYNFFARQMDAGGSWVDETQLYLNPINCFLSVAGQEQAACELYLDIPDTWEIACGLPLTKAKTLLAENYDQLVDSPLICSSSLQQQVYEVQGTSFQVWIQGDCQPDWHRIKRDFQAFSREQLDLFGSFPVKSYHFLNQILPYPHYHGVEHGNSTVITLGPGELLMTPALYKDFLGISSHELFHTWNIKKIRPAEMMPYDYTQENYFRTGFVAEGVTTYYGDYLLARSGVFTADEYFEELNKVLARHFVDYGHENYSVADSSFDLWLDGYKSGIPDRKVSIYHKGALAALILDLEIRRATRNQQSLDTVMVHLWEEFGQTGKGYTEADYKRLAEAVAQTSLQKYFDEVIYGTAPLQAYLEAALNFVGCTLLTQASPQVSEAVFGFKTAVKDGILEVTGIAPGSPAAAMLSLEDELIAVNGRRISNNLGLLLPAASPVELTLFRNKKLRQVTLSPASQTYFNKYLICKQPGPSEAQQQNFSCWLKQPF